MIEVIEAVKIINQAHINLPDEEIPLEKAIGRVSREDVFADTDFPPFDKVMMDGIAIKWKDFEAGLRTFKIRGVQAAGSPQMTIESDGHCLEVMTGAVSPIGADVVIPYEELQIDAAKCEAKVLTDESVIGKNIHKKGTDKIAGALLISNGTLLGTPEIAIAASVGKSRVLVVKQPTVAIVSTGNELVGIDETPLPHQIRKSNVYALAAELFKLGINSQLFHLSDDKQKMIQKLGEVLSEHQIVLMSGGVSKGKFDFVPEVLGRLGVVTKFHRIRQKPGKPLMFGVKEAKNVVFAFPGNPVSTFMCFHKYFIPWLKRIFGIRSLPNYHAILAEDFSIKTGLAYFLQVEARIDQQGKLLAKPQVGKGSGDHANLLGSNAFLELPAETYHFKKGDVYPLIPFREI
jgi:molybdopterin molybdotransferase